MVGGDGVAHDDERPGTGDACGRVRLGTSVQGVKEGGLVDVGAFGIPGVEFAGGDGNFLPFGGAVEHVGVASGEHVGGDGIGDGVIHFGL